jgi:hypothetical protein
LFHLDFGMVGKELHRSVLRHLAPPPRFGRYLPAFAQAGRRMVP